MRPSAEDDGDEQRADVHVPEVDVRARHHAPQHRPREVGVDLGGERGLGRRFGRSGGPAEHGPEDLLLARPDHEPHVEPHDGPEQPAEQDPHRAMAHAAVRRPAIAAALDVDQVEEREAEEERPHRAPAEEVQRAQDQRRVHLRLELLGQAALEGQVDEVEEVQVPDPGDARDDVEPAEDGLEGASRGPETWCRLLCLWPAARTAREENRRSQGPDDGATLVREKDHK